MADASSLTQALFNGASLTCPRCGEGRLFSSYLKRVDACPHCGEGLVGLDADDGPAWLTIVLSTHALWPVFMYLDRVGSLSAFTQLAVNIVVLTALVLFILPRAKGVFIAHMWWLDRRPARLQTDGGARLAAGPSAR